ADHQTRQQEYKAHADRLHVEIETRREERSALLGRADVLDALERDRDGLGAGVGFVLEQIAAGRGHPALLGLVADLLAAPPDLAPLVDLALGDAAQRFVVSNSMSLDDVIAALGDLPGRVGFVPLSPWGRGVRGGGSNSQDFRSLSTLVHSDVAGL